MSLTLGIVVGVSAFVVGFLIGSLLLPIRKTKRINVTIDIDKED